MDHPIPADAPADYDKSTYGYAGSDTDATNLYNDPNKKRVSRAGTRSVSTLSTAQLERKRANDRDAQRAIRQRTKDHIDGLERTIAELKMAHENAEKMLVATRQQNRDLVEENALLRARMQERENAGSATHAQPALSLQTSAPIPQPQITSQYHAEKMPPTAGSLQMVAQQRVGSGTWFDPQMTLVQSAPASIINPGGPQVAPTLTTWRTHEGSHGTDPTINRLQEPFRRRSDTSYEIPSPVRGPQWSMAQQQQQLYNSQQMAQQQPPPAQQAPHSTNEQMGQRQAAPAAEQSYMHSRQTVPQQASPVQHTMYIHGQQVPPPQPSIVQHPIYAPGADTMYVPQPQLRQEPFHTVAPAQAPYQHVQTGGPVPYHGPGQQAFAPPVSFHQAPQYAMGPAVPPIAGQADQTSVTHSTPSPPMSRPHYSAVQDSLQHGLANHPQLPFHEMSPAHGFPPPH